MTLRRDSITPLLEKISTKIHSHLDQSNFAVEIHQCFLDLAVGGTATLYAEETEPGSLSAFKFTAVPIQEVVLEEGDHGFLDTSYRRLPLTLKQLVSRYQLESLPTHIQREGEKSSSHTFDVLEVIEPGSHKYNFNAILGA